MDTLYAHIHKWMSTPFIWGESDCMIVVADYVMALGYSDPAAKWRGKYDSALSCNRISGYLTDPVKPAVEGFTGILERTDNPQRGDVGVIRILDADGRVKGVGAVCLGNHWAVKSEHKVICDTPIEVLAAWRVDHA